MIHVVKGISLSILAKSKASTSVRYQSKDERIRDTVLNTPEAARFLGVHEDELVDDLVARFGIPVTDRSGFAYHDLSSLALDTCMKQSVPELGLQMMMRFAQQAEDVLTAPQTWSFKAKAETEALDCEGDLLLRQPSHAIVTVDPPASRSDTHDGWIFGDGKASEISGTIETTGSAPGFINAEIDRLYDWTLNEFRNDQVRFQWVNEAGRQAYLRTWNSGRADCVVVARIARSQLHSQGVDSRIQSGRILGLLDAQHVWAEAKDLDGRWRRFDPLLELNCSRIWGESNKFGSLFRGGEPNALPGWPGEHSTVVLSVGNRLLDTVPTISARRLTR